jgi:1,4-dihydroxy-2-naphthoate octaprenyltransferase
MTGVASVLLTAATILGIWSALSVLAVPVLVQCLRTQARQNSRRVSELYREAWGEASGQLTR